VSRLARTTVTVSSRFFMKDQKAITAWQETSDAELCSDDGASNPEEVLALMESLREMVRKRGGDGELVREISSQE